jgi:hypothetical protein
MEDAMLCSRRTVFAFASLLLLASFAFADPGKPNFAPAVYGDGQVWGTKAATTLSGPNEHDVQSFDKLFVFVNAPMGQLAVSEAAPGNPMYNGGRWFVHTVIWTQSGMDAYPSGLPILTSYNDIQNEFNPVI